MINIDDIQDADIRIGFRMGEKAERERIIKLLEGDEPCIYENHPPEACHCAVIAFIKGEKE